MKQPTDLNKIFVIGLPRTGTTSLCVACLDLGFKVAHTAYTNFAFKEAKVLADTPIYTKYPVLDSRYPGAKFIYLQRAQEHWVPSIQKLLNRMYKNVVRADGGFNPYIKACFQEVFSPFTLENINDPDFLWGCYQKHEALVNKYFAQRNNDLLKINISDPSAWQSLITFLHKDGHQGEFQHFNKGGKVTAWNDIKHPLKVPSTHKGRIDKLSF